MFTRFLLVCFLHITDCCEVTHKKQHSWLWLFGMLWESGADSVNMAARWFPRQLTVSVVPAACGLPVSQVAHGDGRRWHCIHLYFNKWINITEMNCKCIQWARYLLPGCHRAPLKHINEPHCHTLKIQAPFFLTHCSTKCGLIHCWK